MPHLYSHFLPVAAAYMTSRENAAVICIFQLFTGCFDESVSIFAISCSLATLIALSSAEPECFKGDSLQIQMTHWFHTPLAIARYLTHQRDARREEAAAAAAVF